MHLHILFVSTIILLSKKNNYFALKYKQLATCKGLWIGHAIGYKIC